MDRFTLPRRGLLPLTAALALAPPRRAHAQDGSFAGINAMTARANAGTVGVIAGGVDGTYIRIATDLAAVLDDGVRLRIIPIIGKGSLQNLSDIMFLRGIDIGIVQSDALAFARRQRLFPGLDQRVNYIAKLYDEEVHLLAGPAISRVEDLANRPVNVDVRGSGTAMTSAVLFESLGIPVQITNDVQDTALDKLRRGEIAAMVYVAGKPARLFSAIPRESNLHFVPLPMAPSLLDTYLPAELTAAQYPALVPDATPVETIAVGAVMAAYAWQAGTDRHRKVATFVDAFFENFDAFLRPPRHPKWREVNLAARVPGWTRLRTAEEAEARLRIVAR
ncbi:TRAP transporter substrate-binding protein [Roseomonas terrae]|uniref:TRAP transporter substrate-binding protein n=1 Tax=Neoroseomonas terrae TaxID=424799 RepID=A0ABS5EI29_9PROT|nr:TAXI family TRAP transporter solute-binding subunit [Neoroseomonas terrae]MBR0650680.1 TRAP transporter substrate-binding protein [Neoroseomonas terrae]